MGGGGLALPVGSGEVDGGGPVVFGEFVCDFCSGDGGLVLALNHICDYD